MARRRGNAPVTGPWSSVCFRRRAAAWRGAYCTRALALLSLLLSLASGSPGQVRDAARPKKYTASVGVWAETGEAAAVEKWTPTIDYLSSRIPRARFDLLPMDYEPLVGKVQRNALDFVIADPALYVLLENNAGIEVIATVQDRFKGRTYALSAGTLFCLKSRVDLITPLDLRRQLLATVQEKSLADWLSIAREYRRTEADLPRCFDGLICLEDEEAVAQAVLDGRVAGGCLRAGALERLAAEGKVDPSAFRILVFGGTRPPDPWMRIPPSVSTRLYPEWCLAACSKAPQDLVKEVAAALLTMPAPEEAPGVIDRPRMVGWTSPRAALAVHECLQELRLAPYEDYGRISFVQVLREYMYWFIAAGTLMIVMTVVTLYVTALNRALVAEIGERKRAEVALRESVERFENIASCSADWIWETDVTGHYTYSSSVVEQLLGYNRNEIIGRHTFDLLAASEKARRTVGQSSLGSGNRLFRERYRLRTKDGRVVIHEITAEPILGPQGQLIGYRGVNRDITDQVRFVRLRP